MSKRNSLADTLESRARRAIFWHALLRWESASVIALTMVISAFLALVALGSRGGFSYLWALIALGIGLLTEAIIVVSSVTDEEENSRVVAALLRDQYKSKHLRSRKLREQLNKALEYQGLIVATVQNTRSEVLRDRLARATEPVDDWIEGIYRLATRLDVYEQNRVIKRDLRSVPLSIDNFNRRLAQENDPAVQATLRNTIADKVVQLQDLSEAMDEVYAAR
jgi:hypothetical protein